MIHTNGLHVFIFCCAEYKELLNDGIKSIKQYLEDPILSLNIVTNVKADNFDNFDKDCKIIEDFEFWTLLDKDFNYKNLYNHNWYKQQIFKLAVDNYVSGNVLILDAEVIFTRPTRFIQTNGKIDFYDCLGFYGQAAENFQESSIRFMKDLLDLDVQWPESFVSEAVVFSTDILQEIRKAIEAVHGCHWLTVLTDMLLIGFEKNNYYTLSEYELYGNYVLKYYKDLVSSIKHKNENNFISRVNPAGTTSYTGGKTKWLTFYQQVRGIDWPDCENEEDFVHLPDYIKKECVEQFGYKPELHGGK